MKEIVFHKQNIINVWFQSQLPGFERVFCQVTKIWAWQAVVGMRKQVDYIMHICNQHTYLLTQMKRQGLPHNSFDAIILVYHVHHRLGEDIWMQQILIVCNSLLKQRDIKSSQTIMMYCNYLIIVICMIKSSFTLWLR